MNSKVVIVVAVQFILACAPLTRQAAALDRTQDPEQLWSIGWELSQDCLTHRDTLRSKDHLKVQNRERTPVLIVRQQQNLLQELLPARAVRVESSQITTEIDTEQGFSSSNNEQETRMLEELLVETVLP